MELKLDPAKWRKRRGMRQLLDALGANECADTLRGRRGARRPAQAPSQRRRPGNPAAAAGSRGTARGGEDQGACRPASITGQSPPSVIGHPYEVTTLRRDVSTDGRRATVAFTDDWKADAARRDFTINALSADPRTGQIFDYFGGLDDLERRHIRFIGDPLQRIAEDHLRILRFFRFHARFGCGEPDTAALEACTQRANDLMALSRKESQTNF